MSTARVGRSHAEPADRNNNRLEPQLSMNDKKNKKRQKFAFFA